MTNDERKRIEECLDRIELLLGQVVKRMRLVEPQLYTGKQAARMLGVS